MTLKLSWIFEADDKEDSRAAAEAKAKGLDYMQFGRYGKNGKVTHLSRDGKLVPANQHTNPQEPVTPVNKGGYEERPEAPPTQTGDKKLPPKSPHASDVDPYAEPNKRAPTSTPKVEPSAAAANYGDEEQRGGGPDEPSTEPFVTPKQPGLSTKPAGRTSYPVKPKDTSFAGMAGDKRSQHPLTPRPQDVQFADNAVKTFGQKIVNSASNPVDREVGRVLQSHGYPEALKIAVELERRGHDVSPEFKQLMGDLHQAYRSGPGIVQGIKKANGTLYNMVTNKGTEPENWNPRSGMTQAQWDAQHPEEDGVSDFDEKHWKDRQDYERQTESSITELSPKTLQSYRDKSKNQIDAMSRDAKKGKSSAGKFDKRAKGISTATTKLKKNK